MPRPKSEPYRCSGCGKEQPRDNLSVKKVQFVEMGEGGKLIRSRVKAWLCPNCVVADPDWQLPANKIPTPRRLSG